MVIGVSIVSLSLSFSQFHLLSGFARQFGAATNIESTLELNLQQF